MQLYVQVIRLYFILIFRKVITYVHYENVISFLRIFPFSNLLNEGIVRHRSIEFSV